jgi:hypothetical protein
MMKITREWEGQTCAILASGPSMTLQVAEQVRTSGCRAIAVNNQGIAFAGRPAMAPWADILYASDSKWWYNYQKEAAQFKGRKFTVHHIGGIAPHIITDDIHAMQHGGVNGFDERTTHLRTGSNSGFAATHLAIHLGARRILLCGFDMHCKRGEHWFGDHFWRRSYRSRYDLFINSFKRAAAEFMKRAEIINCTPGSALKCFPSMDLKDALDGLPIVRENAPQVATAPAPPARFAGEQAGA